VLVADTVAMNCHLLVDALERSQRCEAVAAPNPKKVLQLLATGTYEVVVIGIGISEDPLQSIGFLRQIQARFPDIRIVVLLDTQDRTLVVEAFRAGARGICVRSDSFESLCKCIVCVQEGQVWASSTELQFVLEELAEHGPILPRTPGLRPLSKREQQITTLVAEGFSNRQISERLNLSEHTVKNYLFRVFEKLGVTTRVGLTLYALKQSKSPTRPAPPIKSLTLSRPQLLPNKDYDA